MNAMSKLTFIGSLMTLVIVTVTGIYVFQTMQQVNQEREDFGQQVRSYLLENPAVIREAIEVLTAQEQKDDKERKRLALLEAKEELEQDGYSKVLGNPDGDVTIVEFFDYRCGYCKRAFPTLMKTVTDDGNIRLVMKEFPILGDQSVLAARAVMAAQNQGKYQEFHASLMQARGSISQDLIMKLALNIGLNPVQLQKDMKSDTISNNIRRTHTLARQLGISGTPAFVIGGALAPGAIPEQQMKTMVAEARARQATATN